MMTFYINDKGYEVSDKWVPNSWVSVECPTSEERNFLISGLEVPDSFISDIEDNDERPRRDEEDDGWQLVVIRVPVRRNHSRIDFTPDPLRNIIRNEDSVTI